MPIRALSSLAMLLAVLASCMLNTRVLAFQQEGSNSQRIAETLDSARAALIEIRRDLHRHPEVSGQEERTAGVVAERLRALGLTVETGVGGHGVVGVLQGGKPGPVVAYRADMDAVRSSAPDPVPFRSETPGVRHICGHDIHTTTAHGVAEALAAIRDDLPGTVKFIFQPAEENVQGAQAMIRDGVLENPAPAAIFAFHTAPLEVGQIGAMEGMGLSGMDRITIKVSGAGEVRQTARAYAKVISGLSTVGPPGSAPSDDGGFIYTRAGASRDPSNAEQWIVRGTVKASSEENYAKAKSTVQSQLDALKPADVRYELTYQDRVLPDMINDTTLVRASLDPIRAVVGEAGLLIVSSVPPYFGEDFAFYQKQIPGALYWLGVSNTEKGIVGMPHSPGYVADEEAITVGARVMAAVLLDYLETHR